MRILALDPGLRDSGAALFDDATLAECALVRSPVKKERGAVAWNAMAEAIVNWTIEQGDPPDVLVSGVITRPGNGAGVPRGSFIPSTVPAWMDTKPNPTPSSPHWRPRRDSPTRRRGRLG